CAGASGGRAEPAAAAGASRVVAARDLIHASALEHHRVEAARDGQVVAQHDRMAALLGRPPAGPFSPDAAPAEDLPERQVVIGQVVLGEQVHLERRARDDPERAVGLLPRLVHVVAADLVGDVFVREPFGGGGQVSFEAAEHGRLEEREHLGGRGRFGMCVREHSSLQRQAFSRVFGAERARPWVWGRVPAHASWALAKYTGSLSPGGNVGGRLSVESLPPHPPPETWKGKGTLAT